MSILLLEIVDYSVSLMHFLGLLYGSHIKVR